MSWPLLDLGFWGIPLFIAPFFWAWGLERTWNGKFLISLLASAFLMGWPVASTNLFFEGLDAFAAGAVGGVMFLVGAAGALIAFAVFVAGDIRRHREVN